MTAEAKQFKSYSEQLALLEQRGMIIEDHNSANELLQQVSYYRLSGYWHPMHCFDPNSDRKLDIFQSGASFDLASSLYHFDCRLRQIVAGELASIELSIRALLGHELGRINPLIHLDKNLLGAPARQVDTKHRNCTRHSVWLKKYKSSLELSREDFVKHHKEKYDGKLPIWAAVEIMDWRMLSHLFGMAPNPARNSVASVCGLKATQLESWLKSLNVLRNYSAHHARLFNRVFVNKPRFSDDHRLALAKGKENKLFAQLTLVQFLHRELNLSRANVLPQLLREFPTNDVVPFSTTGTPEDWQESELWTKQGLS